MNQHQASGAEEAVKDAHQQPDAKPSGQAGAQAKDLARDDKEGRLRKAYSKVKDALKNSRHA